MNREGSKFEAWSLDDLTSEIDSLGEEILERRGAPDAVVDLGRTQAALVREALRRTDAGTVADLLMVDEEWVVRMAVMRPDANPRAN